MRKALGLILLIFVLNSCAGTPSGYFQYNVYPEKASAESADGGASTASAECRECRKWRRSREWRVDVWIDWIDWSVDRVESGEGRGDKRRGHMVINKERLV